ncbi:OLC1v1035077C1 [Oldenlandia corymbosa var. corymbosa]|uniref:OLC1v1035077C1 n=1 Tax=Oldenlandia corymbosa var. corymbosa TaxID=529605 RepID=A0AAV1CTG2_OLDCO|nr:OLC1v1035077C1 [Oldenlandia corymbosa var. corymbosa]
MEDYDEVCNTKLALGIGSANSSPKSTTKEDHLIHDPLSLNLSFGLGASSSRAVGESSRYSSSNEEEGDHLNHNNNNNNSGSRKKLRLSREQSFVLEENFKEHTTLNTAQKNSLATLLNLKPRQVEVWFQNRRASELQALKKFQERVPALRFAHHPAAKNGGTDSVCLSCCRWKIESDRGNPGSEPPAASSLNRVAVDDKKVVLKPKQSGLKMHG